MGVTGWRGLNIGGVIGKPLSWLQNSLQNVRVPGSVQQVVDGIWLPRMLTQHRPTACEALYTHGALFKCHCNPAVGLVFPALQLSRREDSFPKMLG